MNKEQHNTQKEKTTMKCNHTQSWGNKEVPMGK